MSFSQALSGLNAQSQRLGTIGNNIANSQTVGFKGSNVQFSDVFANSKVGLGTQVSTVLQNFKEGNIESTGRNLDLAVAGEGFFRYQQPNGEIAYSRNGQLTMTASGELINAQGAQIMGYGLNAQGAVQVGGQPVALTVDAEDMPARATTNVNVTFNLDSREVSGSDLNSTELASGEIINYHYANNFTVYDSLGNPVNATVYYEKVGGPESQNVWQAKVVADGAYDPANDFLMEFNANGGLVGVREIDGDYLTAQDTYQAAQADVLSAEQVRDAAQSQRDQRQAELEEAQATLDAMDPSDPEYTAAEEARDDAEAARDLAQTELTTAEGELTTAEDARDSAETAWVAAFNALESGQRKEIAFDIDNGGEPLVFNYDPAGSTQFGNASTTSSLTQNGYTSGALVGITIEEDGTVMRNYSNEQSRPQGQIALVNFRNPEGLNPAGDNLWTATQASGQELIGAPGTGMLGGIISNAIETSNVDMAGELVNMIVAQRAYQANSQTIKTQDELLQTVINLR
ncbi:flagellar hook-basal body complex protein [Billgrantia pellis]|uniref:Flagellar hook protein FlgE n=1 Tax=Billgrantia pellis TaxID=2606936 RepID=A0A7V7KHN2_9GAMM|nr:flagellar hook-basal body complex protein [Halomonas pellis]KAA0014462.1 flagellar hook-basal body complex protein [Halomonas pellis]